MTKRRLFDYLASDGPVHVQIDATRRDVLVPEYLHVKSLVLVVGWSLPRPIRDLVVNDVGIRGGFSFGGKIIHCEVPWEAVHAMNQGDFVGAWAVAAQTESKPDPEPEKPVRHLRSV